jgi:hypothetical protein
MNEMLVGAIAMAWLIAALFFLRFWKTTGDRFFLFFFLAFSIEGINRVVFWETTSKAENVELYYFIRLAAYGMILLAILDKNRSGRNSAAQADNDTDA